jgi:signal transduction histidine kinase
MESTLRILCLEDNEDDFTLINRILGRSGFIHTKRVDTKDQYMDALTEYHPHVILSDHSLPEFNSTEALNLCRASHLKVPFILVTGAVSDEFAVSCIKLGADDYVLKSNLNRLPSAIRNAIKHHNTERDKQIAMSALAVRNDELSKINTELDTFVYSVSHNLRAPLMSVLGLLGLAKNETDPDAMRKYHALMETSIHKLDDTLKEILEYSRNARQDLKIEQISFRQAIEETLDKMKFMSGSEWLDIRVSVEDAAQFHADAYRISVILNNLISNAIKYLDQSKDKSIFEILITTSAKEATLEFRDNGIGIQQEHLPKIFDMFFRATTRKEGAGLGLYIVKEAVEKLQGTIEIKSEVGNGTSFVIHIPNWKSTAG